MEYPIEDFMGIAPGSAGGNCRAIAGHPAGARHHVLVKFRNARAPSAYAESREVAAGNGYLILNPLFPSNRQEVDHNDFTASILLSGSRDLSD